ncbi:glycosyltransferase family 2 protein [Sphingobacterium faecale]|uniref:Glycosyltransferase family 2 protein n=1 Tax=Sphingobacterium faecale TaxID=2803775 RepID=A0ABS1QZE6_9SPHI|nr:glycosyltransferase family 2 protein [Sphingobacterium faecale]MBL1407808.1 glycosyltransferase family 2 protein [Sphingobacterium faecale]
MTITVLIPNYNGRTLLEKFLPSVFASLDVARAEYEFIIVDDCSSDSSVEFLRSNYPEIKVIQNDKNLGFSKTCNRGIMAAQGDRLLLLNSDIQLTPNYIKVCLESFVDQNTFAIMGQAIDSSCKPQTTGILYKQRIFSVKKYANHSNNETHFVSGANSVYDTNKLKELRGFNPIFSPYYFEDDDLSFRAMQKGWKSYFIKEAICFHLGSSSIKSAAKKRKIKRIYFRNKLIFNRLHCKSSTSSFNRKVLATTVLPKYCAGQFWIWNSYRDSLTLMQS